MIEDLNKTLYQKYQNKKKTLFLLFLVISLIWISLCIVFLFISKRGQIIYLIINITLTIIYGFYLVYYLTKINNYLSQSITKLKTINNAISLKEYLIFVGFKEEKEIENLKANVYEFKTLDGTLKDIYYFGKLELEKDNKYLIESKLDYLVLVGDYHE